MRSPVQTLSASNAAAEPKYQASSSATLVGSQRVERGQSDRLCRAQTRNRLTEGKKPTTRPASTEDGAPNRDVCHDAQDATLAAPSEKTYAKKRPL